MPQQDEGVSLEKPDEPVNGFIWKGMKVAELLYHRDQIDAFLPARRLADMNLEEEMLMQYHSVRELQTIVMQDENTPANQKAQVANSVTSSLNKLTELQGELYSSERFKAIENILIRTLNKLPEELAKSFLEDYRKVLERG
jgi:hypothetical protein